MDKTTAVILAGLAGVAVGFGLGYLVVSNAARAKIKGDVASGLSAIGLNPTSGFGGIVNSVAGALVDAN